MLLVLLTAQAATAAPPLASDLLTTADPCSASSSADVTVCGRRDEDRYRIAPQYRLPPSEGLGRAAIHLGKVGVEAVTEQGDVGGIPTNRVMIRIRIPL